ncbi:hypothetical protein JVT61DRAFT_12540 [Boletus reticuloceps]|uniref:Cation-transporting P-type ATPase N-terminal domain-containing protein n=1 Tax=Boletus reticuloceps TaxID=495285 RepID=A0A8I3A3D1_9AGAM|nr:hypothetical protein JVT61DRAFT_12540 [Boletus reticuloceps]
MSPPPDLLSPHPPIPSSTNHRSSFDTLCSPSPSLTFVSSNDASSFAHPPSSTLSTQSSVHVATSLALRDNKPDERSGFSSLQLLSPSVIDKPGNRRKGSITTLPAHMMATAPLTRPSLTVASHTHFDSDLAKLQTRSPDEPFPSMHIPHDTPQTSDPPTQQDPPPDLGPFSLDPDQLASLLDPKDLDALQALGGTTGVLNGLGTHPTRGLLHLIFPLVQGKALPRGMITVPDPHTASSTDRKAVYGENVLPHRQTTSLLGLMWHALKDKVLVLLSIAAVMSLALGLFQDFGTPLPAGQPPVNWVEGVAIIIAILIVVVVGSLNDWQKERQFEALNQKNDERTVKVIRNGKEHLIDIKICCLWAWSLSLTRPCIS